MWHQYYNYKVMICPNKKIKTIITFIIFMPQKIVSNHPYFQDGGWAVPYLVRIRTTGFTLWADPTHKKRASFKSCTDVSFFVSNYNSLSITRRWVSSENCGQKWFPIWEMLLAFAPPVGTITSGPLFTRIIFGL